MSDTVYIGGGKKQNDTWIKATINPDKFEKYIEEFKGNKFIRLNINIKDQPDQYGKDVSISIDTWKPEENKQAQTKAPEVDDDLPF